MDLHRRKLWGDRLTWLLVAGATGVIAYQAARRPESSLHRYILWGWVAFVVLMLVAELRVGRRDPRPSAGAFSAGWAKLVGEERLEGSGRSTAWTGAASGVLELSPQGLSWRARDHGGGPAEVVVPWTELYAFRLNGVVPLVPRASGYLTVTVTGGRELVFHVQGVRRWRAALREAAVVGPTYTRPDWLPDEAAAEFPALLASVIDEEAREPSPVAVGAAAAFEPPPYRRMPPPPRGGAAAQPAEPESAGEAEAQPAEPESAGEAAAQPAEPESAGEAEAQPAESESAGEAGAQPAEPPPAQPPVSEEPGELEAVIGLECHVELSTASKVFCSCPTTFGAPPNTQICEVCTGQPGVLPVLNERAVEYALRIALALNCEVAPQSVFHRKNYFYPDMPKNYQISQYDLPLARGGWLDYELDGQVRRCGIHRVHLEEDTGKTTHAGATGRIAEADYALVDYNRAGVPLVEIVSEPDLRTPEEARAFLAELRALLEAIGVSDVRMEEGSLRCDANVSVRRKGSAEYGTKVEVKNMNSLRSVQRALAYEIERQRRLVERGKPVVQQTRHFDEDTGKTSPLRTKEYAFDYRYFPDPDLVPLVPDPAWLERIRAWLPEPPAQRRRRFVEAYGLSPSDARTLTASRGLADAFEEAVRAYGGDARAMARWYRGELAAAAAERGCEPQELGVAPAAVAELQRLVDAGRLTDTMAKTDVLRRMIETGRGPAEIVEEAGLAAVGSEQLESVVDEVLAAHSDLVAQIRGGKTGVINRLVGEVMRRTQRRADAAAVKELIDRKLNGS